MKHLLSCEQYTRQSLEELFKLTDEILKNPKKYSGSLVGNLVSIIFYEPSTRTRLSFESAVQRLGGTIISTENAKVYSSAAKGETLEDTIKVISGYCDAIVIRHNEDDSSERASKVSSVPIINAGAGKKEHPTQSLLDLYTIKQQKGRLDNIKLAVLGDLLYGRTIHSLVKLISLYDNISVYGLSKKEFALPQKYIDYMNERNVSYTICSSFDEIPSDVDVLYHTRTQYERFDGNTGREEFIINKEVLNKFSKETILLHPLPRNEEISTDVDEDPRALFFKQAHNGVPVRMAILLQCLDKSF